MIGKILILATVAVANARHVLEPERATVSSDRCKPGIHHLLPHEWDCTKFYYCEYGEKWVTPRDCAPGTEFSYELQTCVHPDDAHCTLSRVPPASGESESNESAETEAPTEAPITEPTTTEAPSPSTEPATLEPASTTEAPSPSTEPATLEPASTTQAPSPSTEPATLEPASTTQAPSPSTEPATLEPASTTQAPTEAPEIELLPNGCPADFEVYLLLPHETRCDKFYYCVFGEKVVRDCPPNTAFNPDKQICDEPENVDCVNASGSSDSSEDSKEDIDGSGEIDIGIDEILPNGCPASFDVLKLLPHESDCSKFYYCIFGETVERNCAPGTYFNPALEVCDRPENVECANGGNGGSGENGGNSGNGSGENGGNSNGSGGNGGNSNGSGEGNGVLPNGCPADFDVHHLLPHENNCAKFYYCVFGKKVERYCAPGTLFSYAQQVCVMPADSECANGSGENGNNSNEVTTTAAPKPYPTTSAPITSPTEAPEIEVLPNGCPADFDVHLLLPHESDCAKFYYCVFGKKVERECDPGTLFSAAQQVCVMPADSECANGSGENGSNGSGGNGSGENGNSGENNGNGSGEGNGVLPNGCPADFDVHHLLPHENNCAKFYYCVFGKKVERNCAPGTLFSYAQQVCVMPADSECANGSGENGNNSNEVTTTAAPKPYPTTSAPITSPTEAPEIEVLPNGCPADFDVHLLLPHESDCAKFYYCVFGKKVERECDPGTLFSAAQQVCVMPADSECANGSGENGSNGSGGNGSGENGNSGENNGNGSGEGNGVLPNGCPADFDVHHLLPHENNCAKFYYCVFGKKVERNCAPGTLFSYAQQVCVMPADSECANGSGENGNNSNEVTTTAAPKPYPTTSAPITSPTEAPEIEVLPNGCPADFDVHLLLPHESDCAKFYYCVFGKKVERECDPGTLFSAAQQVCVMPADSECANGSGENGSNGSGGNGSGENGNSGENNGNGSGEGNGVLPNGCPADFDVHHLLPHENNCAKFYYCVFGKKVERNCAPGTLFSYAQQVCVMPADSECANGSGENGNNSNEVTTTTAPKPNPTTSAPITSPTEAPEIEVLPNGCPADFDVNLLLPHESNCGKFYYCVFGEKVERDCAAGTHFSFEKQECVYPEEAGCENGSGEGSGEGSGSGENGSQESGEGSGDSHESGGNGSGENGSQEQSDKCKNSCNVPAWAHKHDCDKFWRCDGETAVLVTCAEGLHFNAQTKTCDFICNAGCVRDDVQSTPAKEGLKLFLPWDKVDSTIRSLYLGELKYLNHGN